jgi:uncharacterized protein
VTPRAAADRVRFSAGTLHVWVCRPPVEGEANGAVIRLVARALRVAPSSVSLATGVRSRRKWLVVAGLSDADLATRLADLGD